eukprot:2654897-Prymnesium_polylepis.3
MSRTAISLYRRASESPVVIRYWLVVPCKAAEGGQSHHNPLPKTKTWHEVPQHSMHMDMDMDMDMDMNMDMNMCSMCMCMCMWARDPGRIRCGHLHSPGGGHRVLRLR